MWIGDTSLRKNINYRFVSSCYSYKIQGRIVKERFVECFDTLGRILKRHTSCFKMKEPLKKYYPPADGNYAQIQSFSFGSMQSSKYHQRTPHLPLTALYFTICRSCLWLYKRTSSTKNRSTFEVEQDSLHNSWRSTLKTELRYLIIKYIRRKYKF